MILLPVHPSVPDDWTPQTVTEKFDKLIRDVKTHAADLEISLSLAYSQIATLQGEKEKWLSSFPPESPPSPTP